MTAESIDVGWGIVGIGDWWYRKVFRFPSSYRANIFMRDEYNSRVMEANYKLRRKTGSEWLWWCPEALPLGARQGRLAYMWMEASRSFHLMVFEYARRTSSIIAI